MGNEKIIYLVVIFGVLGISLGFITPAVMSEKYHPENVPVHSDPSPDATPLLSGDLTLLISTRASICEECHMSGKVTAPQGKKIKDHIEGGAYCLKCHKISHEKHPIDGNVTCQDCHGSANPRIPSSGGILSVCANCHGYPDALSPGYGNIITIHQPRGVNCISCHLDCMKCHEQALTGKKWEKRLNHFNALPDTYK